MTVVRVQVRGVHNGERRRHLSRCVKGVRVRFVLHLLHDDICASDDEVKASILGEDVAVNLALQSVLCIVCTAATDSTCVLIHVDKQGDGSIAFGPRTSAGFP